jgi:PAS domain S-box-containing protein
MTEQTSPYHTLSRLGVAVAALAAAIVLRWLLDPLLHDALPLTALFAAIAVTVWACGYRYAIPVAAVGYVACNYLFIDPRHNFTPGGSKDLIRLCAYLLICLLLIGFGEALRRAQQRYRAGEAAARQRAETLSFILANVGDAVITTDLLGNVNSLNPGAESLTGWSRADASGQALSSVFRIVNEDTGQAAANPVSTVLRERRAVAADNPAVLISRQGKQIPAECSAAPLLGVGGALIGAVLIFHEISERREAEKRERQTRTQARTLMELNRAIVMNMGEGLYTVDAHGLTTFVNPAAERLLGWTSAELLGRNMHEMIHYKREDGSPFPREECAGVQVLHDNKNLIDHEDTFIRKDGSFLSVAYSSSPLWSGALSAGGVVVFRDTTQQKRTESQLRELAANLSAADRRKDVFLATLAHELRNPLAPIRNALEIIRLSDGNASVVVQARMVMERQLAQLIHLVDDLLDVSRITLGKITLRKEPTELLSVLNDAVETSRPLIEAGGHEINLDVPHEPVVLEGDRTRLVQVFANVLNNAAKYSTRGGHIRVSARREGSDAVVKVQDGGFGIPPDKLAEIFEMFAQIESSSDPSKGGLGIGLALVRHLTALHGGSVDAKSAGLGLGSEFVVRLPALPEDYTHH